MTDNHNSPLTIKQVKQLWAECQMYPVWVRIGCRQFLADRATLQEFLDVDELAFVLGLNLSETCHERVTKARAAFVDVMAGSEYISDVLARYWYETWHAL